VTSTTGKLFALALFSITEVMPPNFGPRALKMEKVYIVSAVHGNLTAHIYVQLRGIIGTNWEVL
jgi:hypothetical protein